MRHFSPRRLFAYSLLWWIVLSLLAPFHYTIDPTIGAVGLLVLFGGSFIAGTLIYDLYIRVRRGDARDASAPVHFPKISRQAVQVVFWTVAGLAVIGLALRFYDLIVVKSYLAFDSGTDFKMNYDASQSDIGAVSIISALLMPFALVLPLLGKYYRESLSRLQRVFGWLGLSGVVAYFVMRGGRTSLTLILVMITVAAVFSVRTKRFKLSRRTWVIGSSLAVAGVLFFFYSLSIMIERLDRMGFSVVAGLDFMESHRHLEINDQVMQWAEESEMAAGLTYTAMSIQHYFLHGYHQFSLLESTFDEANRTWGAAQFYPAAKFLGALGIETWSATELEDILEEPAVYYTFFGPVYMDFGYWGFLYCFILGLIVQMSWKRALSSDPLHRLVYPYIAAVILHSSYLNMIQSGLGLYFLFALLTSGLALRIVALYGVPALMRPDVSGSLDSLAIARK